MKALGSDADKEEMDKLKKQVIYIDNYPSNWKYISLFATSGDGEKDKETEEKRKIHMEKIIQTYNFKIQLREKEVEDADKAEFIPLKKPAIVDAFFMAEEDEENDQK